MNRGTPSLHPFSTLLQVFRSFFVEKLEIEPKSVSFFLKREISAKTHKTVASAQGWNFPTVFNFPLASSLFHFFLFSIIGNSTTESCCVAKEHHKGFVIYFIYFFVLSSLVLL